MSSMKYHPPRRDTVRYMVGDTKEGALPASRAALPPYGLSRCASQAKPAAANAKERLNEHRCH